MKSNAFRSYKFIRTFRRFENISRIQNIRTATGEIPLSEFAKVVSVLAE